MNKSVLFSPVSTADPINDMFDGAMLHIVRYQKPEVVFLYLTEKMMTLENQDNRFEDSIHYLYPECIVEKIPSRVESPHLYDQFVGVFNQILHKIHNDYPEHELLVNVSSGTPQIKNSLTLEAISSNIPMRFLQVSSPSNGPNRRDYDFNNVFDVEEQFSYNLDHQDPEAVSCRIIEPQFNAIRKNNISFQIKALVQTYQYQGASTIYNLYRHLFSDRLGALLKHASERSALHYLQSNPSVPGISMSELYPVRDKYKDLYYITEFLQIMCIKMKNNETTDFIVKMTPILYELCYYYLFDVVNLDKSLLSDKVNLDASVMLTRKGLSEKYPELLDFLDSQYRSPGFRDSNLSANIMIQILRFLMSQPGFDVDSKIFTELQELRDLEIALGRNEIAHVIATIEIEEIKEKAQSVKNKLTGARKEKSEIDSLEDLYIKIKNLTEAILSKQKQLGYCKIDFIYDRINAFILDELEK